jgi:transcriptional activator SPT7
LRLCAKRLKIKSERLLRNITDRKERADPSIPAALGGGGPPPGRTSASPFPSSKPSVNGTAPLANGHRPPKITIKPPTRKAAFSVGKRDVPAQTPFAEMPALIRTADGMNAFAQLARDADIDPTELRPYLPPDLDAQVQLLTPMSVKEEQDDDAEESLWSADSGLGDKRKW